MQGDQGVFLTLTDLDSANGTFVNDCRVTSEQRLAVGDLIALGGARLRLLAVGDPGPALP